MVLGVEIYLPQITQMVHKLTQNIRANACLFEEYYLNRKHK